MKVFVSKLFKKLAKEAGVKLIVEPKWGIAGQIIGDNGKKSYFRETCFDLNTIGATEIAIDKDYAAFFMKKMGYPVIKGKAFCSPSWAKAIGSKESTDAAYKYALKLGFPVIVKPNSKSQGRGVSKVYNREQFYSALRDIFHYDNIVLVQRIVTGKDYRLVVLDGDLISAYQRIPLSIIGDGKSTIVTLLKRKQIKFDAKKRDTVINLKDSRIQQKLASMGMNIKSVPANGQQVFLLDNANLSTGGDSLDVTDVVHKDFKQIAKNLAKDMNLRFCGIDLIVKGDISKKAGKYVVIEINAAPGLDHYFSSGKAQQKIVEDLYLHLLKSMK